MQRKQTQETPKRKNTAQINTHLSRKQYLIKKPFQEALEIWANAIRVLYRILHINIAFGLKACMH